MLRKLTAMFLTLSLTAFAPQVYAAAKTDKAAQNSTSGARKHMTTIVFAGLAGAILGLSTLSFYGRPQDKLSNIAVGFAIGVIGGTVYTTYKAAAEPKEFYDSSHDHDHAQAELWAYEDANRRMAQPATARTLHPGLAFSF